ncbi:MAG: N-acetylneuraminate synthase family protein [Spirochaetaceae bacterium]|jgi:sialic acid synthase SpsE|nr:N-acetylneuraminate synthase family protein [Spirochaetaceae bacterium]
MTAAVTSPFIIAELGTSHGGSIAKAKALVDAAAASGADCVKFQIVYADEILHPNTGLVPLPGGDIRLYDVFKKLEVPPEFFGEMKTYAESKNVVFLASPFGPRSAAELKQLAPMAVKIASPELNYTQLVREVARWGVPVLLSSGVSTLADIEAALALFDEAGGRDNVILLHCVTSYPAPLSEYNLRLLTTLRGIFGVQTGVSDHSLEPEPVPCIASALGASAIEKHFCLSRDDPGLDDPIALPPARFAEMVKAVRLTADIRREGGETKALAALGEQFGAGLVGAIVGDGVKRLSPSEAANYGRTNRSIHALVAIPEGALITAENTAPLRTEKVLRPGLPPALWEKILGCKARVSIPAGEGVRLLDICFPLSTFSF